MKTIRAKQAKVHFGYFVRDQHGEILFYSDYKTFKQATGTMILLVYVGSIVIWPASSIEWRK